MKSPLLCATHSDAFLDLLKTMADKPQDYITPTGKVTTNAIEGFHGLALKYSGKRIDLEHAHYCCKTNMAVCPKNLGPVWKLICLCKMGVDVPKEAVSAILDEQCTTGRGETRTFTTITGACVRPRRGRGAVKRRTT